MSPPSADDWSFTEVAKGAPLRATLLEAAPSFERLIALLQDALSEALASNHFRCGTDFYQGHQRAIFQFRVRSDLYDWFFNSRSSYRAKYWIAPKVGQAANIECLQALCLTMLPALPHVIEARKIETEDHYTGRKDTDIGSRQVLRSFFKESFTHAAAKVWMCERLIRGSLGPLQTLRIHDAPRLLVQRWPRALCHCPGSGLTWLDLKGGFVGGKQTKNPWERAVEIYNQGFT